MIDYKNVFVIDSDLAIRFDVGRPISEPGPERVNICRVGEDVLDALEAADFELFRLSGNYFLVKGHEQRSRVEHDRTTWQG